jgi:hypothetical protein
MSTLLLSALLFTFPGESGWSYPYLSLSHSVEKGFFYVENQSRRKRLHVKKQQREHF